MRMPSRRTLFALLKTVVIVGAIFFAVRATVLPCVVLGHSMEPTLHNDEWVLVDRVTYWIHGPQRGDIVVFKAPDNPGEEYIKRVIGLPGDHVVVQGGRVWINGQPLTEHYIAAAPDYADDQIVPQGYLYVLGDNRDNSDDSHVWGLLPQANIVGHVLAAYWPLNDLSLLLDPSYGAH
jgi:signal peptidase I